MPFRLIREFLRFQASGGLVLVASAAAGLLLANLPFTRELYQSLLEVPVDLRVGSLELDKNLLLIVNDGLMAVFFLLVGLEIKREMILGELKEIGQVAVPAAAALGGLVTPAVIYAALNRSDPEALAGWAIPAATDIAFALGVLALFGSRAPLSLKVFLTTVAIIDDLAAIVIVALFYSGKLSLAALIIAGVCLLVLTVLNRASVTDYGIYMLVGVCLWLAVLKSGVHATLAGVLVALFIPLKGDRSDHECPARRLEHALHPWAAFFVLPIFAFANAGVSLAGITVDQALGGVSLGILSGLLFGKVVGVSLGGLSAVKLGLGRLPDGVSLGAFLGVCFLCGIGFTMSLFIGSLAFDEQGLHYEVATRVGVFGGSLLSAAIGAIILHRTLPRTTRAERAPSTMGSSYLPDR